MANKRGRGIGLFGRVRPNSGEMAASADERAAWLTADRSGLERVFQEHRGRILHKWVHYLPIYERYFSPYRDTPVRMLEIGVSQGGSLEMWRRYFGPQATIFGVDINPNSAACVDPPNQVRIGSQADPAFLTAVVAEMGVPDIVLDDGSHMSAHQAASFDILFPLLGDGGLYVIEDMHTAYWPEYRGGYRRKGTAVDLAKRLVDDLHHWYHDRGVTLTSDAAAIHQHDSIVIVEKRVTPRPMHIHVGAAAPADGSPPVNAAQFPPFEGAGRRYGAAGRIARRMLGRT